MGKTRGSDAAVTRRNMLKGAAVAGGVTIATLFAGLPARADEGDSDDVTSAAITGARQLIVHGSDILVVGGGLAGCTAARRAMAAGKTVNIIDKGQFGHSGASGQNWGALALTPEFANDGGEGIFSNIVYDFFGLVDQDWAWSIVQGAKEGQLLISYEKSGCVQQRNPDGTLFGLYSPDYPVSMLNGGKVRRYAQMLHRLGATVFEYMMMVDVIQDVDGRCGGVLALDIRSGTFHVFRAKETIVATGTNGWVMKPTTMSQEDNGDTHAILAKRGLALTDMEMTTFDYASIAPYSMSGDVLEHAGILTLNSDQWDRALNSKGEKYCESYFTSQRHLDNPSAGFAMFELLTMQEVMKGETVFYDTTNLGRQNPGYSYGMVLGFIEDALRGLDYTYADAEECDQAAIITCGHVNLSPTMQTEVPGLFSALTNLTYYGQTQAFGSGWVAGGAAADAAEEIELASVDYNEIGETIERLYGLLEKEQPENGTRANKVVEDIRNATFNLQYPRSADGIKAAIDENTRIREEELPSMYCADKSLTMNNEWKRAIEAENILMNAECIALASDMRKETRPWFYRSDYPKIDNENWFKHITCSYDGNGGWKLDTADVNATRISADEIMANLMDVDLNAEI